MDYSYNYFIKAASNELNRARARAKPFLGPKLIHIKFYDFK